MLETQITKSANGSIYGDCWAILNFEDTIAQLERTKQLYLNGQISYMIFDLETAPELEPWKGEIIMFSWAHTMDNIGYCVPIKFKKESDHDLNTLPYTILEVPFEFNQQQKAAIIAKVRELLAIVPIAGHNIKYDINWLTWHGWADLNKIKIFADTLTMAFHIFNKTMKNPSLALDTLVNKYCEIKDKWAFEVYDYLGRFKRVKDRNYGMLPTGMLGIYAAKDSIYNRYLLEVLTAMMPDYMTDINNLTTYAIKPFSEMETKGIYVDRNMKSFLEVQYEEVQKNYIHKIKNLPIVKSYIDDKMVILRAENDAKKRSKKTEEEMYEEAFNISSNKQLIDVIYGSKYYSIPVMESFKTEKGAPQVSADFIEFYIKKLQKFDFDTQIKNHEMYLSSIQMESQRAKAIREFQEDFGKPYEFKTFLENLALYKKIEKLRTTYIDNLDADSYEGMYKPEYKLTFVKSGRASSGFHTIPSGNDIKRLYSSRWESEGGLFLAADQSQLELRIGASLSNEPKMIKAFQEGIDAHTATASQIYRTPVDKVDEKQRKVGKTVNFGIFFGKTAKSLAEDLGCSEDEAQAIINGFFAGYDRLDAWIKYQINFAYKNFHILTPWGRKIPIEEAEAKERWIKSKTERVAVNYPIQSTASDLVLSSVVNTWNRMKFVENCKSQLVGCVHDSIEIDVYPGEIFNIVKMLWEEAVEKPAATLPWLTCPLKLSYELGTSWGGAMELDLESMEAERLVFKTECLRKDLMKFKMVAERAYKVSVEVLKEKEVDQSKVEPQIFVRDFIKVEAKIVLEKK